MKILFFIETLYNKSLTEIIPAMSVVSQLSDDVQALVIGDKNRLIELSQGLQGVFDTVNTVEIPPNYEYTVESYSQILFEAISLLQPDFICSASTSVTRELLPKTAAKFNAGTLTDVISFNPETKDFKIPLYAGNLIGTAVINTNPAFFTIRTAGLKYTKSKTETKINKLEVKFPEVANIKTKIPKENENKGSLPGLTVAKTVIACGRGIGSKENIEKYIVPLAKKLNAAIGGTRAACDAGYLSNDLQIGQTGKIIAPDLYIGLGISGAIQHVAGIRDSGLIVAVNKEENAAIFDYADVGIVAKWEDVIPEFTTLIENYVSKSE